VRKKQVTKITEPKGHGEKLSRKGGDAIDALITEGTVGAAAEKAGIGEKTLRRWLQDPGFRERYHAEARHRLDAATRGLNEAAATAIGTLWGIVDTSWVDTRYQLTAAKVILDAVFKKARLYDVGQRLSGPERKVQAHGQGQSIDDAEESLNPITEQSTVDALHRVPCSGAVRPTPSIRKKSAPDTELHSNAHRGGDHEPANGPTLIRRRGERR
jgi:hypothetical protein